MKMKKVFIKADENNKLPEAIVCLNDICKYGTNIITAILMKMGKENDTKEKIDPDQILSGACESMEHFVKVVKPFIK